MERGKTLTLCIGGPIDGQWRNWRNHVEREPVLTDEKTGTFTWHLYYKQIIKNGKDIWEVYRHESVGEDWVLTELGPLYKTINKST